MAFLAKKEYAAKTETETKLFTQRKSRPSNFRVLVKSTVRAGMLRPIANVSVANNACNIITT